MYLDRVSMHSEKCMGKGFGKTNQVILEVCNLISKYVGLKKQKNVPRLQTGLSLELPDRYCDP